MEIFLKILKEIGIAILLGLLVATVAVILFYRQIPFSKQIPESINYTNIDKNEYNVRGDVEDLQNDTETYVSKASQLKYYELIKYVLPGRHRPFASINSTTDIPTEYVGQIITVVEDDYYEEIEPLNDGNGEDGGGEEGGGGATGGPEDLIEQGMQEQGYGEINLGGG